MARPLKDALTEEPLLDLKSWFKKGKSAQDVSPTPVKVQQAKHTQVKKPRSRKQVKRQKWISAGGVVVPSKKDHSKVLVIKPSNNYGPWSLPKGRVDAGETMQQAALREVWEETGVKAKFMSGNSYVGRGKGSYSISHFFLMYRQSGNPRPTNESEKAIFVPWDQAINLFVRGGNKRDPKIVLRAMKMLGVL